MQKLLAFSKPSTKSKVEDLIIDDTQSVRTTIDIEAFKVALGPLYEPIKELKEKYLQRIESLQEQLENLQDTILKLPPIPEDSPEKPKTTKGLLRFFLSTESYKQSYNICEVDTDNIKRLRIHAFLSNIKDYGQEDQPLQATVEDYKASALENIETKIRMMSDEARSRNITLIRFINKHL